MIHIPIQPKITGVKRLQFIYDQFCNFLDEHLPEYAAIEGYAYNAKGLYFNLGEVGGILRIALYERSIPTVQVPPTVLKKYITGSGNANKDIIIKELYKKFDLDINDNNAADAAGLAILAREYFETSYHCIPVLRTELHKKCDQVIGDHPNELSVQEYLKDMPDGMRVHEYEKLKKTKKND